MLNKRKSILALIVILMFLVIGCSSKEDISDDKTLLENTSDFKVTVKDSYDREVTIESEPKRVISTAQSMIYIH